MYRIEIEVNGSINAHPSVYCNNVKEAWHAAESIIRKYSSKVIFPAERPIVFAYVYKDWMPVFTLNAMYRDGYYSLIRSRDLHHIIVRDGEYYD